MAENDIQVSVGVTGDNVIEQLRAVSNAALKQMAEDFKASSAQMNASLNQVAENTNKVTRETHDTRTAIEGLTDQIKNNFLGALSGMAVGFISVQGAMTVFNKLKEAREELRQQSAAYNSLTIILGHYSTVLSQQAAQYEATMFIDRKETVTAQERLAVYVKDDQWIAKLIPAALNLSQAMGVDLATAAQVIGRNISSDTGELGRYHIAITGAMDSTERMQSILTQINKHIGDQGEAIKSDIKWWEKLGHEIKIDWQDAAAMFGETETSKRERLVERLAEIQQRLKDINDPDPRAGLALHIQEDEMKKALDQILFDERTHAGAMKYEHDKQLAENRTFQGNLRDINATGEDVHGYKETKEQKDKDKEILDEQRRLQDEQRRLQKEANEAQLRARHEYAEAMVNSIPDEWQREQAQLAFKQQEEIEDYKKHGWDLTELLKAQLQEMDNLKAEHDKKEQKTIWDARQVRIKILDDALNEEVRMEQEQEKKMVRMEQEQEKKTVSIALETSATIGKAFGTMFDGKKGSMKKGLKEMLDTLVDFAMKEVMVYTGLSDAESIAESGIGGIALAAAETAAIEAAGALIKSATASFALGTGYASGGLAMVGEHGPEMVNLPRGAQVYNNTQTRNITENNGHTVNVHLYDNNGNFIESGRAAIRGGTADALISAIFDRKAAMT